jgi:hypothetical protein
MKDPINPSRKRVTKKTDVKSSDKKSTMGVETKTVFRKDKVTPKKIVKTEYTNYYTPSGGMMGGSTITSKEKEKFDKSGKLKSRTTLTPIKKTGGATDEKCWPGKPGCGYKRAQRVNNRRSAASKVPVGKVLGAIGAGVVGALAIKNKDKIKETLGMKTGGPVKKISKMQMGGDPTMARKCPKGKCGKVSVAPVGGGMQTMGSKIKSGVKKLFTQGHKAGPGRAKRIR